MKKNPKLLLAFESKTLYLFGRPSDGTNGKDDTTTITTTVTTIAIPRKPRQFTNSNR